jgi:N-acyl-D-aspartate/D-glutamate deacylase
MKSIAFVLCLGCLLATQPAAAADQPVDADVLLTGGTIYDGTGGDGFVGDVAIKDDKIVAVGTFRRGAIEQTIDCRGLLVAPGYIDLHNHSDRRMASAATRANVNFLTQGCTTIVTGNCGGGPIEVGKFIDSVNEAGAGTNVVHLLPHGALRSAVLGSVRRPPSEEELTKMCELAEKAMREGAWGMSTGLIYVPGTYADTAELIAIAKVVGRHGGIYASHIRNEGTGLIDAVREALEIGREAELPVHVSHFKASGRQAWGSIRAAAQLIEQAREAGQRATADQYPYIASSTSLEAMTIPTWAREGGSQALLARLDDAEQGPKLIEEIQEKMKDRNRMVIASYRKRPEWVGKSLDEIADAEGRPQVEIIVEITRGGGAAAVSFGMHEEDVRFAMQLPWVATASDGSSRLPDGDRPHPRSYGTFSRKIGRYALAEKVLPVAQAVRSSSGLPADILGLADRGYLKPGLAADVVAFDPRQFMDHATFDAPYRYSTGMRYVYVSGQPAIFDGVPTGALAGRALRHPPAEPASGDK